MDNKVSRVEDNDKKTPKEKKSGLVMCPACKKSISVTAKACPKCGYQFEEGEMDELAKAQANSGKKGCLLFLGIFFIFAIFTGIFSDDEPSKNADNPGTKAVPENIMKAMKSASTTREALRTIKLTYDITLPTESIYSLSADEITSFMTLFLQSRDECKDFERTFITVYTLGVDTGLAVLSYENKTGKISVTNNMWNGYKCGLKTVLKNEELFYNKIRWYCNQVSQLAQDFAEAYNSGKPTLQYKNKSIKIMDEWEDFLNDNTSSDCYTLYPAPYGPAKTKALSILLDLKAPEFFDPSMFARSYKELNEYTL